MRFLFLLFSVRLFADPLNEVIPKQTDAMLRQQITESESVFSERLDVSDQFSKYFLYKEEFERVYATYSLGELVTFTTYKVTQHHCIEMEKQALTWVMKKHSMYEEISCVNYPWLTLQPTA